MGVAGQSLMVGWSIQAQSYEGAAIDFTAADLAAARDDRDSAVEAQLGWPLETISYLRAAFTKRLSRVSNWSSTSPASVLARSIYKRGLNSQAVHGSYPILFGEERPDLSFIQESNLVVIDEGVAGTLTQYPWYQRAITITPTEQNKSLATIADLYAQIKHQGAVRIVVIGGGILCDMVGFLAYLTQKKAVYVPTTLLAMVDASIGGKTAVNFAPFGKNQIGAFHFPEEVRIGAGWLTTLPEREFRAGIAESLKHAFLAGDEELARRICEVQQPEDMAPLLYQIVSIKAEIVERDPNERGERATLNLGHTLGHALEGLAAISGGDIRHGEAVGVGLCYMLILARTLNILDKDEFSKMSELVTRSRLKPSPRQLACWLNTKVDDLTAIWPELYNLILQDKKMPNQDGALKSPWVLLQGMGRVYQPAGRGYITMVEEGDAKTAWHAFLASLTTT